MQRKSFPGATKEMIARHVSSKRARSIMSRAAMWVFVLSVMSCHANALDIDRDEYNLYLSGEIKAGDLKNIVAAVSPPQTFPKNFVLNSPGGSIREAMAIGQFIRETATQTFVKKSCSSACIFLLIAGVLQGAWDEAEIGLHRPYFDAVEFSGLSLPDADKKYKILHSITKNYLEEMGMTTAAIEKMFSVASDNVFYLSPREKSAILSGPPAYPEWIRAKCNPPTATESELFKARGFNYFERFDKKPPTDPSFWGFIAKSDLAERCEASLVKSVREAALTKYMRQ